MKKAKFIRKYYGNGYERNFVFMDYEYRGHEYTVYENLAKVNEPLAWQHRTNQNSIDAMIETEKRFERNVKKPCKHEDTSDYDIDCFLRFVDGDGTAFE